MHDVEDLFPADPCRTRLWVSRAVVNALARRGRRDPTRTGILLARLRRYAQAGFALFEGRGRPVRREWKGVYRIGSVDDLFRIIGFYEDDSRASFIAIDAFLKKGRELSMAERRRIDEVVRVKKRQLWRRSNRDGQYPRLA